jgi:hypothetical protein
MVPSHAKTFIEGQLYRIVDHDASRAWFHKIISNKPLKTKMLETPLPVGSIAMCINARTFIFLVNGIRAIPSKGTSASGLLLPIEED